MKKYIVPKIKVREVVINNFLSRDNTFINPFSDFSSFLQMGTVYAYTGPPGPPNSGTAGLKDKKIQNKALNNKG